MYFTYDLIKLYIIIINTDEEFFSSRTITARYILPKFHVQYSSMKNDATLHRNNVTGV